MCHNTFPYYLFCSKEKCCELHLDNVPLLSNNTMFCFLREDMICCYIFGACLKRKAKWLEIRSFSNKKLGFHIMVELMILGSE